MHSNVQNYSKALRADKEEEKSSLWHIIRLHRKNKHRFKLLTKSNSTRHIWRKDISILALYFRKDTLCIKTQALTLHLPLACLYLACASSRLSSVMAIICWRISPMSCWGWPSDFRTPSGSPTSACDSPPSPARPDIILVWSSILSKENSQFSSVE